MNLKEKLVLNEEDAIPAVELEPSDLAIETEIKPSIDEVKLGLSQIISDLIKDEWEAIDGYNSAVANFSAYGVLTEIIDVLKEIAGEEMVHVGQLEKCLTLLSPNAEKIDDGQIEAEKELKGEDGHTDESLKEDIDIDPTLRAAKNIITGKTFDEYMEKFGDDYTDGNLWDFSEEELAEDPSLLNNDIVYWDIDGRLYETPEMVRESMDVRKKVLQEKENIPDYLKYWYDVAMDEIDYLYDEEWDDDDDFAILKEFPDDALEDLAYHVAEEIGNNDYVWETINEIIHDRISTWIKDNADLAKPNIEINPESGE